VTISRRVLVVVVAGAGVLLGAAPAAPPEYPVNFIHVDELKAELDRGMKADLIDVRHWDAYVEQHIRGARSMPLRAVEQRAGEISRTGLVVFY
jgi:rhodanese-like protein